MGRKIYIRDTNDKRPKCSVAECQGRVEKDVNDTLCFEHTMDQAAKREIISAKSKSEVKAEAIPDVVH